MTSFFAMSDTVTEELKCDSLVSSISSPIEWLKFGGVEMKFSEKIDLTSETGKHVLQLHESLISKGLEFVQNDLLPAHCTLRHHAYDDHHHKHDHHHHHHHHHHHRSIISHPKVIEVGLSNWLGSYSASPFDQFLYYNNSQTSLTRWQVYPIQSEPHVFWISNDLGYHWSYDHSNKLKRIVLQQDSSNHETVSSNWFHIHHNTGSISPHHHHKLFVYGYASENPSSFLPVGTARLSSVDDLKIVTDPYAKDGDACNT